MKTMERLRPEIVNEGQSKKAWRRRLLIASLSSGRSRSALTRHLRSRRSLAVVRLARCDNRRDLAFGSGRDGRRPNRFGSELARACHWNDLQEQSSYKRFLILQGRVWLALVAGLATNKLWSYRAAIAVFTGFAIYQIYRLV
jgi:hypothetical protein